MVVRSRKQLKRSSLITSCAALLVAAVGPPFAVGSDVVPDFWLTDVNETSTSYGEPVSPRDYLQQVSAWYFGNAT